jgi:hypothetical protein
MTHISVGKPHFDIRIPDRQSLLLWRDDLSVGPVPRTSTLAELSRVREAFWNAPSPLRRIRVSSADRDRQFGELAGEVVIWCGENRREVLMLAAVLYFSTPGAPVWLVPCGGVLGVGACNPDDCAEAYRNRRPLEEEGKQEFHRLWRAYIADNPLLLSEIASSGTSASASIAIRILEEYPAADTGLSRIEETLLANIRDGMSVVSAVAETLGAVSEPIGDAVLFDLIWSLAHCSPPALQLDKPEARDFRLARIRKLGPPTIRPRWVGGVEINGPDFPWRYDRHRRRVVFVS